jgi:hypothetical protein
MRLTINEGAASKECGVMSKFAARVPLYAVILALIGDLCCRKRVISITTMDCDGREKTIRHHKSIEKSDGVFIAPRMI